MEATVLILKREFQDQKEKINIYFEHLKEYDSQDDGLIGDKIVINTTQKSSAILILYNIIESIVSRLLGEIHDKIMNETILYHEFNDNLRRTIFIFYKKILDENNIDKNHKSMEVFYFLINGKNKIKLTYNFMVETYQLFSGNLDAKEIRSVFKNKYGFEFNENELKEPVLKRIREGRNNLAHGDQSFEEYGRNLTIQDIVAMKDKVFSFLDRLIEKVEIYLTKQLYKKLELREEQSE